MHPDPCFLGPKKGDGYPREARAVILPGDSWVTCILGTHENGRAFKGNQKESMYAASPILRHAQRICLRLSGNALIRGLARFGWRVGMEAQLLLWPNQWKPSCKTWSHKNPYLYNWTWVWDPAFGQKFAPLPIDSLDRDTRMQQPLLDPSTNQSNMESGGEIYALLSSWKSGFARTSDN